MNQQQTQELREKAQLVVDARQWCSSWLTSFARDVLALTADTPTDYVDIDPRGNDAWGERLEPEREHPDGWGSYPSPWGTAWLTITDANYRPTFAATVELGSKAEPETALRELTRLALADAARKEAA